MCWMTVVTRNVSEAVSPSSAAAEEAAPLGDLGDIVMTQPDGNDTDVTTAPTPALHDPLPPGKAYSADVIHQP